MAQDYFHRYFARTYQLCQLLELLVHGGLHRLMQILSFLVLSLALSVAQ